MQNRPNTSAGLRRVAEARLKKVPVPSSPPQTAANTKRLLHELQVHQVELEMQNAELRGGPERGRNQLEAYTDLYDFAPVGYYSVDEQGLILEVNLTGAALLGVERARLIKRRFLNFVTPNSRTIFQRFFRKIFMDSGKQICMFRS